MLLSPSAVLHRAFSQGRAVAAVEPRNEALVEALLRQVEAWVLPVDAAEAKWPDVKGVSHCRIASVDTPPPVCLFSSCLLFSDPAAMSFS